MRLSGQIKMGYYPTPASTLPLITAYLSAARPDAARLLDPCCGKGEALAYVAQHLATQDTWGAELSPDRANAARNVLGKVHSAAWQHCKVGRGVVSLLYLNPPYGQSPESNVREEQRFLEDTAHCLCDGGILIYIVPKHVLGIPAVARHLAARYERICIARFPDEDYAAYKQVVLFGVRRARYTMPSEDAVEEIAQWARLSAEGLPALEKQATPMFTVPPGPERDLDGRAPLFRRIYWEPEELIAAANAQGVRARSRVWRDAFQAIHGEVILRPVLPMRLGHVAMLTAAGLMGVMQLKRGDDPIVAKGRVIKTKKTDVEETAGADGRVVTKTIEKDVFITSVSLLDQAGQLEIITDQTGLGRFMRDFGQQLGEAVLKKHQPEYAFNPSETEWAATSQVALNMRLPGRKEGGLLPTQRHIAIAASRALKKHKSAIIAAEQGTGKSLTACGVLEVLHAYPAIVLCPPHLIHKWVSEIERGVPGAVARVINCIERGEDDSESLEGSEDSERSKLSEPSQLSQRAKRYSIMDFVRDYRAGKLGARAVAVVSRERAKLGSGWAPVAITRKVWDRESHAWVSYLADPDTGQILLGEDDVPLIDSSAAWRWLAVKQRFAITEPVQGWTVSDADDKGKLPRRTGEWGQRQARTPLFTQGQGIGSLQNVPMCSVDGQWLQPRVVEHPEARVGFRRYPIASFIHRKLKGFFKLLIGDEMHQYQAPRSDQAIAFHQISRACKWTLGLSATIFGGKSTSLYHLLHRTSGEMRNDYGVHDERRWAQAFGVLEVTRWRGAGTGSEGKDAEDGAFSGYGRERTVVRELPGISPAVIRYLLPHTVFARIADLGYRLPPYREQVVRLDMDLAQREQYWERVYDPRMGGGRLYTLMKQALKEGDHSLLSVWLQTALARPNSCFRADEVLRLSRCLPNEAAEQIDLTMAGQRRNLLKRAAQHVLMMTLDPVVHGEQWLPKERWLIDYCREQIEQGRKVLVYVRQTGTRDIQPRIVTALKSAMIRARVLPANLKPEHREAWVQSNTSGMDVLVVNPQKVDTGLDLIMFHSIVWYELQYSLYVMWQAMRRVWRLGQTKPVEVIWLSYRSTLEDLALSLMGKKLYAAQLLYGDEVGGAIVESDDGSFLTELARAAMDKAQVEDLSQLFAGVSQGQHDEAVEGSVETLSTVPAPTPEPIRTLPPVAVPISPLAAAVTMEAMRSSVLATQFGLVNRRPKSRVKPLALAVQSPLIGEAMGEALVQLGLSLDV